MINFFTATLPVATFLLQGGNAEQSILRVQVVREQDLAVRVDVKVVEVGRFALLGDGAL